MFSGVLLDCECVLSHAGLRNELDGQGHRCHGYPGGAEVGRVMPDASRSARADAHSVDVSASHPIDDVVLAGLNQVLEVVIMARKIQVDRWQE